ncbi:NUDIX hydrolase [Thermopetrobacter sp. TC1]|uniref:NUDIX hydrolase n=1 Tax=Thermopetrobacter sp. TC1 TaxID=1495045 RepID=UPI00056DC1DE|nr:NUDIX hydrolase [Thermopetrobacter sp. TC1]
MSPSSQDPALCPPQPVAGVSVCVIRDDSVLLVRRAHPPWPNVWSLPGGKVELGEPVRTAALRELREETGVTAEIVRLLDVIDIIHKDPEGRILDHFVLTVFAARWVHGEPEPASDADEAAWIPIEVLDEIRLTPGTADLIRRVAADLAEDDTALG